MEHRKVMASFRRNWKYVAILVSICIVVMINISKWPVFADNHGTRMLKAMTGSQRTEKANNSVYVLLVAYPRTGSSFLGDLLSIAGNVFYLYEPSYELRFRKDFDGVDMPAQVLNRLFSCDPQTLRMLAFDQKANMPLEFYWERAEDMSVEEAFQEMVQECLYSPTKLIKEIRCHLDSAIQLLALADHTATVKVVHLVRDPRAMLHSLMRNSFFKNFNQTAAYYCAGIRKDLVDSSRLSKENYMRIRYEDLVSSVLGSSVKLYDFIGSPLNDAMSLFIASHKWAEKFYEMPNLRDFSTFRASNYDPYSWKRGLSSKDIQKIKKHCGDIIKLLHYDDDDDDDLTDVNNTTELVSAKNRKLSSKRV